MRMARKCKGFAGKIKGSLRRKEEKKRLNKEREEVKSRKNVEEWVAGRLKEAYNPCDMEV